MPRSLVSLGQSESHHFTPRAAPTYPTESDQPPFELHPDDPLFLLHRARIRRSFLSRDQQRPHFELAGFFFLMTQDGLGDGNVGSSTAVRGGRVRVRVSMVTCRADDTEKETAHLDSPLSVGRRYPQKGRNQGDGYLKRSQVASTSGLLYRMSTGFFRDVNVRDRSTRRRVGRRR
jgi:hypothetical protein